MPSPEAEESLAPQAPRKIEQWRYQIAPDLVNLTYRLVVGATWKAINMLICFYAFIIMWQLQTFYFATRFFTYSKAPQAKIFITIIILTQKISTHIHEQIANWLFMVYIYHIYGQSCVNSLLHTSFQNALTMHQQNIVFVLKKQKCVLYYTFYTILHEFDCYIR